MFFVFSWLHFLNLIILHNRYILNLANFSEIFNFCWKLLILAVSIISLHSFVLNVSRVSQLMRSAASPLCNDIISLYSPPVVYAQSLLHRVILYDILSPAVFRSIANSSTLEVDICRFPLTLTPKKLVLEFEFFSSCAQKCNF